MFAKPLDARLCATLLSGATLLLGPVAAQTTATPPTKASAARQAAGPAAPLFGGTREKLVVAMPKTYAKSETMLIWGDYFNHLARCGNMDLQNLQGESLERSVNIDTLGEKDRAPAVAQIREFILQRFDEPAVPVARAIAVLVSAPARSSSRNRDRMNRV